MFDLAKRLLPAPLKRAARRWFESRAERETLAERVQLLEQHIEELRARVFDLTPEIIPPPAEIEQALTELLAPQGLDSALVNLHVSKNDRMYQYLTRSYGSPAQGHLEYVRSGLHMMQVLETIVRRKFGDFTAVEAFLDFASGYGRLTRFLVQALDPNKVWVAEIKARAVEFQQLQFGVNGFVSTEQPECLAVDERFDCIFVASLFSHLPEATFGRWLDRLWNLLRPNGVLVFTVHDLSLLDRPPAQPILYCSSSEEGALPSADAPLAGELYGTTYVSEAFVGTVISRLAAECPRYARYPRGMWGQQDVYVLSRNSADDLSGLWLPSD